MTVVTLSHIPHYSLKNNDDPSLDEILKSILLYYQLDPAIKQ